MITSDQAINRKYLIRQRDLARKLDMSVDAMRKLAKNDPTFPLALKWGASRQAAVYYLVADVEAWLESKKATFQSEVHHG